MLTRQEYEWMIRGGVESKEVGSILQVIAHMATVIRETDVGTQVQNKAATESWIALKESGWLDE